jgi:hypothetical protein
MGRVRWFLKFCTCKTQTGLLWPQPSWYQKPGLPDSGESGETYNIEMLSNGNGDKHE